MIVTGAALSRSSIVERYRRNRGRSRALFDLVSDEAYYRRPIAWRHPIAFYEGHLPAFAFNTLAKRALGRPSIDARFETLFARGIDPDESATPVEMTWPARKDVLSFADEVDRQLIDLMEHADCADAVFTVLEHEAMHQETLLYMWHRLPFADKKRPRSYTVSVAGGASGTEWIDVPGASRRWERIRSRSRSAGITSSHDARPRSRTSRSSATTPRTGGSSSSWTPAATGRSSGGRRKIGDG